MELVLGPIEDDDDEEGFLLAGPELTPGLRPVCVLGELEPELKEALFVRLVPDSFSFDLVLLMVIFMPSDECLTIYSELLLLVPRIGGK